MQAMGSQSIKYNRTQSLHPATDLARFACANSLARWRISVDAMAVDSEDEEDAAAFSGGAESTNIEKQAMPNLLGMVHGAAAGGRARCAARERGKAWLAGPGPEDPGAYGQNFGAFTFQHPESLLRPGTHSTLQPVSLAQRCVREGRRTATAIFGSGRALNSDANALHLCQQKG